MFNHPYKLNDRELPPYEAFYNRLRNSNPLGKKYLEYEKLIRSCFTTEVALLKMRLSELSHIGAENYSYLQNVWEQEEMQPFKDFMHRYNDKDVAPTWEAMQKIVQICHYKSIDML